MMTYEEVVSELKNICVKIQEDIDMNPENYYHKNVLLINKIMRKICGKVNKLNGCFSADYIKSLLDNKKITIIEKKHKLILTDEYKHQLIIDNNIDILYKYKNGKIEIIFNFISNHDLNFNIINTLHYISYTINVLPLTTLLALENIHIENDKTYCTLKEN